MGGALAWLGRLGAGGEEADPGAEAAVERRRHRLRVLDWGRRRRRRCVVVGERVTHCDDSLRLGFVGGCVAWRDRERA
jgi:hypothetical protein